MNLFHSTLSLRCEKIFQLKAQVASEHLAFLCGELWGFLAHKLCGQERKMQKNTAVWGMGTLMSWNSLPYLIGQAIAKSPSEANDSSWVDVEGDVSDLDPKQCRLA